MPQFDPLDYKLKSKVNWNSVAPQYHHGWASLQTGPFKSTKIVIDSAEIKPSDKVLDIACGTGALSSQAVDKIGENGLLVGIDLSRTALQIAKQFVRSHKAIFFEMDAENMGFNTTFDRIICQYGIMFFPDVNKVLRSAKKLLSKGGKISVAVHGTSDEVPYFSSIMKPILTHIPDIRPKDAPSVHRFGNPEDLRKELVLAGFCDVIIAKHVFHYDAGTFEEYWNDYMSSTANSIRPRVEKMGEDCVSKIKHEAEQYTKPFTCEGRISFPWTVLTATASCNVY